MIPKKFFLSLSVLLIFALVTLIFFLPLLRNFSSSIIDDYDGLMITWSLNRIIQKLPDSLSKGGFNWPKIFFEGNIFYPYPYSGAYSDAFITDGIIAWPFVKIFGEPVVAFNANLIISQILLLFFTYLFLSEISGNLILNILLPMVFSFSQIRLHYLMHLQMFSLYWIPLAGFALLRLAKSGKAIFVYLFFFSFLLQTLNSFLPGYFIIFLFLAFYLGRSDLQEALKKRWPHFLAGGLMMGIILLPIVRIYFYISSYFNYVRPITDAIHFSLSPEEIFTKFMSPVLIGLFGFSLILSFHLGGAPSVNSGSPSEVFKGGISPSRRFFSRIFLGVALSGFLMALGPALHRLGKTVRVGPLPIPLPYAVFYYLLPGFKGFRTPSRWIFMFGFGAIAFSAVIWEKFLAGKSKSLKLLFYFNSPKTVQLAGQMKATKNQTCPTLRRTTASTLRSEHLVSKTCCAVVYFLLIGGLIFFTKIPKNYIKVPANSECPKVYQWLKIQPGQIIAEMPIYYWGDLNFGKRETYRMLYSLQHQKMMVNGYSGFSPPEWEKLVLSLRQDFPSEETLKKIKTIGVNYLVVHEEEFKDLWSENYQEKIAFLKESEDLKEIYRQGSEVVYEF